MRLLVALIICGVLVFGVNGVCDNEYIVNSWARVSCIYVDSWGETHVVRSRNVKLVPGDSGETLLARVFVERNNPKRYEIELLRG